MIPVQRPYLGAQELQAVGEVFDSRWLGMGAATKTFEDKLAELLGAKHVIAVNTGTSALHIALAALSLQPGDEVIVPSLTFVASIQAIQAVGAVPVFCDVHPKTLNMDIDDALARVTRRTKAIMPVHFGGEPCDMDRLIPFGREHHVMIVEDAAHAFGSTYKGRMVGTLGDLTCFSFDPIKNITCGEGGAVVTHDDAIAATITTMRILGIGNDTLSRYRNSRSWFYDVSMPGFRYHMSNINAAIGLEQLKRFEAFRARKRAIVTRYDAALSQLPGLGLIDHDLVETFPFFYVVRVLNNRRDAAISYLKDRGVSTGVHYIPNHLQPLYEAYRVSLPATEQVYGEILTLPLYFEMADAEIETVISAVADFVAAD